MSYRILTLLLLLILPGFVSCGLFSKKTYSESGELLSEERYDPFCRCYHLTEYYPDGKVSGIHTYYREGTDSIRQEGIDAIFTENGDTLFYYFWKNNVPHGRSFANYSNGQRYMERQYAMGYKTGTWLYFDEQGLLTRKCIYPDNSTPWNSDADNCTCHFYSAGKPVFTEVSVNGLRKDSVIHDTAGYMRWANP